MQYKISRWQWIGRELTCFFLGHDWKNVPQRKTQWADMEELPVHAPYWERIPWWRNKCARCRLRGDFDQWVPWYRTLKWAVVNTIRDVKFCGGLVLSDTECWDAPMWKRGLLLLPIVTMSGVGQFFLYFDRLPSFLWSLPHEARDWLFERLERT